MSTLSSAFSETPVEDLPNLPGPVLGEIVCDLTREGRRIDALRLAALAAFEASGQWAVDGATSAGAWVSRETHCDTGVGRSDALLARRLRSMPVTEAALAAGDISMDHARAIAAGKHVEGFAAAEAALVREACAKRPIETRQAVTRWRETMGDESLPKGHDRQELYLSTRLDELWEIRGQFDGEGGSIVNRALRHHMDHAPAVADGSKRTTRQRRADAMVDLCDRYLRGAMGTAGQHPHINVICPLETLTGESNEPGRTSEGETLSAAVCRTARAGRDDQSGDHRPDRLAARCRPRAPHGHARDPYGARDP